jgi:hypothetical protein
LPSHSEVDSDNAELQAAGKNYNNVVGGQDKTRTHSLAEQLDACDRFLKISNHILDKYHDHQLTSDDEQIKGVDSVRAARDKVLKSRDEIAQALSIQSGR